MTASGAETRTRLRLTQGESTARSWELVASSAHTTLTIGAGADCNWVIHAEGVRARHVSLQWDGGALRAADLGGAGGASIDGEALGAAWREVPERAELQVGGALISIETTRTRDDADMHPLDGFSAAGFGIPAQRGSQPNVASVPAQSARPASHEAMQPLTSQQPAPSMRKATLVGVAPITADTVPLRRSSYPPSPDGFRVLRPSDAGGQLKRVSSAPPVPEAGAAFPERSPELSSPRSVAAQPADDESAPIPLTSPVYAPPIQYGFPAGSAEAPPTSPLADITLPEPLPDSPSAASASDTPAARVDVMPDAAEAALPNAPSPARVAAMRSGTLIGVAVPEVLQSLRVKRTGGASLADDSQRTLHGYVPPPPGSPGDDWSATPPAPAVVARSGTLIQVLDRGKGSASDATQRIGSAWQEAPQGDGASFSGRPSGVLDSAAVHASRASQAPETWPARNMMGDTIDDPPVTNRAPAGGFPWRYLGIAMLTVVAYFAWLYLLDHL